MARISTPIPIPLTPARRRMLAQLAVNPLTYRASAVSGPRIAMLKQLYRGGYVMLRDHRWVITPAGRAIVREG